MIVTEFFKEREDGVILDRTYSNDGHFIIQVGTGIQYREAIDPREMNRSYVESDELIPIEEDEIEEETVEDTEE